MIRNSLPMSLITSKLNQNVSELRDQIKNTSSEAVTGRITDVTKHLSGRIGQAMLGQKALDDVSTERSLLQLRQSRLDITQQSLSRVQSGLEGIAARTFDAVGFESDVDMATVARDAGNQLESMMAALNTRHGERFLFSGDATSTPPFSGPEQLIADIEALALAAPDAAGFETALDTYFNDPAGPWQTTIYGGSATASDPEARTAIDPALTKIARSLSVLAVGKPGGALQSLGDGNTARLNAANLLAAGETAITELRATVGIDQGRVADRLTGLEHEETVLTEALDQMTGRDQYEAASALKTLEANLEASYILTARLSNLSLMNYIR